MVNKSDFLKNISYERGCWIWTGTLSQYGYGRVGNKLAHRVSYEMFVGPIPVGSELDHLCRVRKCVNPSHLKPVTKSGNQHKGYKDRIGQMSRRDLRIATWCHDELRFRLDEAFSRGSI